jgi:hypothetical protein
VEVTEGRRRLGPLGKGVIGCGVVVVAALIAMTAVAVSRRRVTRAKMVALVNLYGPSFREKDPERIEGSFFAYTSRAQTLDHSRTLTALDVEGKDLVRDAWGHPIRWASPGPVHRHGWDLWSVGPNGIDEQGEGDDILVGEDVADVGSG